MSRYGMNGNEDYNIYEWAEQVMVADAHCDTATALGPWRLGFGAAGSHLDLPRLARQVRVQFMAFFLGQLPPEQAWRRLWQHIRDLRFAAAMSQEAEILTELKEAGNGQKPQLVLAVEGLDLLAGQWQRLEQLYEMGIRSLGLFWNNDNFLGCGAGSEGRQDKGLTAAGRQFVEYAGKRGFVIDLAHASEKSFWEAAEICQRIGRPFFVSHACCKAICPHRRNLSDAQLVAVGESGGIVGVTLVPEFLRKADCTGVGAKCGAGGADGEAKAREDKGLTAAADVQDVVEHIRHAVEVAGPEAVGLGSDFDGVESLPSPMVGAESWPLLAEALVTGGLSRREAELIMGKNLVRFLREYQG